MLGKKKAAVKTAAVFELHTLRNLF